MKIVMIIIAALLLVASVIAVNYRGNINVDVQDNAYQAFQDRAASEGKTVEQRANERLELLIVAEYLDQLEALMRQEYVRIAQTDNPSLYEQALVCLSTI